ncbi:cytokine-dependent hematopoietic cell linker isoform X6 [Ovis canadensis]|uniref:cytokine-dependent hematopoietic cell linker isoform X6 n=1 Tax=Ovis canadensis TaxID=37174 RepID=UPI0037519314
MQGTSQHKAVCTPNTAQAELKIPLICRVPRKMNRPSWPRIDSATGQYQTINEPLLDSERNSIAVLAGAKGHTDGDYEDPELHTGEDWQSVKILPARPIKESEYADTRYFKGMMDTPLSLDSKTSLPTDKQTWMKLEEVEKPISKDIRKQHVKGDKPTKGNKTPLPPPRQISLKNLSEVLGTEKVPYHQMKPEAPHLAQNQSPQEIPLAVASSSFMTRNPTVQNRDHKESMPSYAPQRCQSPAGSGPQENPLLHKITSRKKPFPARSDGKDVQHNEWYIGEYSRQAVEEALLKEHKNGTFLVRDCSAKSRAEPYVLAVFYGNKVYNVKIRFLERNQQFALGTGLRGDEKFDSVEAIIEHYKYFPIILIDGKDKTGTHREQCYLTQALPVNRHFSPR